MSPRRVLLLGRPGLLTEGVHDILERERDVQVLGPHAPGRGTAARVGASAPDVVVIAAEDPSDLDLIPRILRDFPELPLVRVSLGENAVHVHRSEQLDATRAGLLEAIRGTPGGDAPPLAPASGQVTAAEQERRDRIGRRPSSVRRQQKE